jgi:cytochrome c-type biogenesis protein
MLESVFLTVNQWIAGGTMIAALGCFLWGMISVVFSPCHLASIPLIVAYVGGQQTILKPKEAGFYSVALGDVGNYWQILIGLILVWVALGMLGVEKCSMSGSLLYRLNLRGPFGAFGLGLAYGVLSGSCTFGFIAPILAIITVQQQVATGILFILLFAIGHCVPIVAAGSSTAAVKSVMENSAWQGAGNWFRKGAGLVIVMLGAYFIINPFFSPS